MRCVEVVGSPATSAATVATTVELTRRLGKDPVVLRKEIPGFVANRILNAVRDEALYLLERTGLFDGKSISVGCRHQCQPADHCVPPSLISRHGSVNADDLRGKVCDGAPRVTRARANGGPVSHGSPAIWG